ncbi:hypothetical protein [Sphaerisporangium fuscum]|uniref:hypothetical protein n=1 Tax=Sphaerisporangium fuscum TaxID=2835868 RepID=UPI001BDDB68D|nr:hypothetical protein [Sphaerisporangium fuscum]
MEPRLTNPFGQTPNGPQDATAPAPAPAPSPWPQRPQAGESMAQVVSLHGDTTPAAPPAVPAPAALPARVKTPLGEVASGWYSAAMATGQRAITGSTVFREQLPSIAGLWREMAEADWAPREAAVLRLLGRGYRIVLVIPASMAAYTALWILQRPLRLFLAASVTAIALVFIVILHP